ncbi:MAG: hypothetical protein HUJ55_06910 [Ileibacterium sp.]|nr:hypothetical protein [Ileibacterium sp.]
MKFVKALASAAIAASVFAGCSSAKKTETSNPVTHTCTTTMSGMEVTLKLHAPSETDDVTSMDMIINMPAEFFGMSDLSTITEDMVDALKPTLAEGLGLPEEKIVATVNDEKVEVSIKLEGDNIKQTLSLQENANLAMDSLLKELKADDFAKCD